MTAVDLIVEFGRLEVAESCGYRYLYVTVAALDDVELKMLITEFGGTYSKYRAQGEIFYKWKSSNINSLKHVIVAMRSQPGFDDGQPYKMLICMTAYATSRRGQRELIATKILGMMGSNSISIKRDVVDRWTPLQPGSACAPTSHPSS